MPKASTTSSSSSSSPVTRSAGTPFQNAQVLRRNQVNLGICPSTVVSSGQISPDRTALPGVSPVPATQASEYLYLRQHLPAILLTWHTSRNGTGRSPTMPEACPMPEPKLIVPALLPHSDAKRPCSTCVRSHAYAVAHAPPGTEHPPHPECTYDEGESDHPLACSSA